MDLIPISQYRTHGDLIFTAGQVGFDEDGEIPESFDRQMELALRSLDTQLRAAGASRASVLKTTLYITRREDFGRMNELYAGFFAEPWPARTTIVTELALPELLFEIEAIAQRTEA